MTAARALTVIPTREVKTVEVVPVRPFPRPDSYIQYEPQQYMVDQGWYGQVIEEPLDEDSEQRWVADMVKSVVEYDETESDTEWLKSDRSGLK